MRTTMKALLATAGLLSGAAASAEAGSDAEQVAAALNQGKNYADARPRSAEDPGALERARLHQAAMNEGKAHEDARAMPPADEKTMEMARRHQEAMSRGLDHEDARTAVRQQPAR